MVILTLTCAPIIQSSFITMLKATRCQSWLQSATSIMECTVIMFKHFTLFKEWALNSPAVIKTLRWYIPRFHKVTHTVPGRPNCYPVRCCFCNNWFKMLLDFKVKKESHNKIVFCPHHRSLSVTFTGIIQEKTSSMSLEREISPKQWQWLSRCSTAWLSTSR